MSILPLHTAPATWRGILIVKISETRVLTGHFIGVLKQHFGKVYSYTRASGLIVASPGSGGFFLSVRFACEGRPSLLTPRSPRRNVAALVRPQSTSGRAANVAV